MDSKIDWKKYVDQIYVVHYIEQHQRLIDLNKELDRVDILNSGILYRFDNISTPLYKKLFENFNTHTLLNEEVNYTYAFDCTLGHYYCMKHALANNYKRILILENDVRFLKDKNKIIDVLNIMYDASNENFNTKPSIIVGNTIACFNCGNYIIVNYDNYDKEYEYLYCEYDMQYNYSDEITFGPGFNIYNNKAIQLFCNKIESFNYAQIDHYSALFNNTGMMIYVMITPICLQQNYQLFVTPNTTHNYNLFPPTKKELDELLIYPEDSKQRQIYNFLIKYYNLNN